MENFARGGEETTRIYSREEMEGILKETQKVEAPLRPKTQQELFDNVSGYFPDADFKWLNEDYLAAIYIGDDRLEDLRAHLGRLGFLAIDESSEGPGFVLGSSGHVPSIIGRYNVEPVGEERNILRIHLFR